jgi:hypothetical protein
VCVLIPELAWPYVTEVTATARVLLNAVMIASNLRIYEVAQGRPPGLRRMQCLTLHSLWTTQC